MNSAATRLFEYKSIFLSVALTLRLIGLGSGLGAGASALAPRRRMPVLAILSFIDCLPGTVGRRVDRRLAALWIYWVYWAEAARLVSLLALRRLPWQANVAVAAAETSLYASMMTAAAHDSANRGLAASGNCASV